MEAGRTGFDPSGTSGGTAVANRFTDGEQGVNFAERDGQENISKRIDGIDKTYLLSTASNVDSVDNLSQGVSSLGLTDQVITPSNGSSVSEGDYGDRDRFGFDDGGNSNAHVSRTGFKSDHGESHDREVPDGMSSNEKEELLQDMFPSVDDDVVSDTLRSANGNYGAALDQLLNLVYFAEAAGGSDDGSGSSCYSGSYAGSAESTSKRKKAGMRSIDAFAVDDDRDKNSKYQHSERRGRRKRKGRGRVQNADEATKNRMNGTAQASSTSWGIAHECTPTSKNKWEMAKEDIGFLSSRVRKSQPTIASMYHKHGASVSDTLLALIEDTEREQQRIPDTGNDNEKEELDLMIEAQAIALAEDFPDLPAIHLVTLVRLTYPLQMAAYDLAEVLQRPMKSTSLVSSTFFAPSPRVSSSETLNSLQSISGQSRNCHRQTGSSSTNTTTTTSSSSSTNGIATAMISSAPSASYPSSIPAHHFTAAARYARRANRNNHLGGAAAYHAKLGHEALSIQRAARSSAADALIKSRTNYNRNKTSSSSSDIVLDLHGLTVHDALRVVRREVSGWWASLGEDRAGVVGVDGGWAGRFQGAKRRPELVLVTGRGQHSVGGRAKVGPAVIDMLVREGWKVEIGSGVLYVTGRKKKR